jgi:flagellar assembly factor FliW
MTIEQQTIVLARIAQPHCLTSREIPGERRGTDCGENQEPEEIHHAEEAAEALVALIGAAAAFALSEIPWPARISPRKLSRRGSAVDVSVKEWCTTSMPQCETRYFGCVQYDPATVLDCPRGLPGFEEEHAFIAIAQPQTQPLVYLQSLTTPTLCFVALPVQVIDPEYALELSDEDADVIGLGSGAAAQIGATVLCLAILSIRETGVTANLMAPLVMSLASRRTVQAVSSSGRYSHQHMVEAAEAVPA